jgi:hypothetical protein
MLQTLRLNVDALDANEEDDVDIKLDAGVSLPSGSALGPRMCCNRSFYSPFSISASGTQFTCFTSTKVQILTPEEVLQQRLLKLHGTSNGLAHMLAQMHAHVC